MNDRLILSPPPAKDIKLSNGKSVEDSINNLNSSIEDMVIEWNDVIEQLQEKPPQAYFDKIWPIGSIYRSVNSTDPSELFGGTWERLKDRFLLAAGDTYAAGSTGGEAEHTLTVSELPKDIGQLNALSWASHKGDTNGAFSIKQNHQDRTAPGGSDFGDATYSLSGGGNPHNNLPPYLAVYTWVRVA